MYKPEALPENLRSKLLREFKGLSGHSPANEGKLKEDEKTKKLENYWMRMKRNWNMELTILVGITVILGTMSKNFSPW